MRSASCHDRISARRRVPVGFAMGRAWSHLEEKKNAQLVMSSFENAEPDFGFFLLVPINEVTLLLT